MRTGSSQGRAPFGVVLAGCEPVLENVGMVRRLALSMLCLVLSFALPRLAAADARTEFLVQMLTDSGQFRTRMQAALALGSRPNEPAALRALMAALRDDHPAVRAASASALSRLGDRGALASLRAARNDRDSATRAAIEDALRTLERAAKSAPAAASSAASASATSGSATFYIGVGTPSTQGGISSSILRALRDHVVRQISALEGVRIAPENESQAAATSVLKSSRLAGFYLDSSITKIELKPDGGVRAQVSVIVGTYPGRAMRVMLSGAATVVGAGSSEQVKAQAVEAAFTGALRRLPQALEAGLARAD